MYSSSKLIAPTAAIIYNASQANVYRSDRRLYYDSPPLKQSQ